MKKYFLTIILLGTFGPNTAQASWFKNWFNDMPGIEYPDIKQNDDNVIVTMTVPQDINPDNILVEITDQRLHVYGKSQQKIEMNETDFYKKEISSNSFNRSVSLPCLVDERGTIAELNGTSLIITMPKIKEENTATRKIRVIRT